MEEDQVEESLISIDINSWDRVKYYSTSMVPYGMVLDKYRSIIDLWSLWVIGW